MLKVVYYTAVDANLTVFSNAYNSYNAYKQIPGQFLELAMFHRRGCTSVKVREQLRNHLKDADVFIVQLMGGKESMPEFDAVMGSLDNSVKRFIYGTNETIIAIADEYNNVSPEVGNELFNYMAFGGQENILQMLKFISATYSDLKTEFQPPRELPMNGLYYETPDFKLDNSPKVGVIFYRNYFINGDHSYVDELIQSIEALNAGVRAVYLSTAKSDKLDN